MPTPILIPENLSTAKSNPWRFCVAPMIDVTDKHCRYFFRTLSINARLYTEMITCKALIYGERDNLLNFDPSEHPIALQLGGNDPEEFKQCAKLAEEYAYDEINLNIGCPSDRVQSGAFGACLMKEPELVAECIEAIQSVTNLPCTVKTRIGIDDREDFAFLDDFIAAISNAGCNTVIIHARKAILKGLSPKQNRQIPELNYQRAYQIKEKYPSLNIILNGGLQLVKDCQSELASLDGVMLGREIYRNPFLLSEVDRILFNENKDYASRSKIVEQMLPYLEQQLFLGVPLRYMTRHLGGLYHGQKNAKSWRTFVTGDTSIRNNKLDELLKEAHRMDELNIQ